MTGRLVFAINSMEGGGAERAMANLLAGLGPHLAGIDTHLVLLDDRPIEQALPDYLTLHVLDGRGAMARSASQLWRLWRRLKPDTCVSFLARANCLNIGCARLTGARAIISERVHTTSHLSGARGAAVFRAMTRLAYPRAEAVIAVAQGVADDLAANYGVAPDRLRVIGNPIDMGRITAAAAEPPAVPLPDCFAVAMGRLVPNKNFALLLRGFAAAKPKRDLVILGEGPERPALAALAKTLGLQHRLHMPGFLRNPYPVLRRADYLVSTSNAEGFPNTLVEGMCLGLPILATDCRSGPYEILRGRRAAIGTDPTGSARDGMLVPVDDVAALAAALAALESPDLRAGLAARARARAADFGVEAVLRGYLELIGPAPRPASESLSGAARMTGSR